jgi:acetylornithine/succinyldiaminopimelate/putrescine aminotransferase
MVIGPGEHGSTYGGNPMACAVAMAALKVSTAAIHKYSTMYSIDHSLMLDFAYSAHVVI